MYKVTVIGEVDDRQRLGPDERVLVERLAVREREVRADEMQRRAAAGALAMGIDYVYERGPDGRVRAAGGRIRIAIPPDETPAEVRIKVRQLRTAANASTSQVEADALQRISKERIESLGDLPGVCSLTSFGGLNRTA